jgi:hypothetical protein
MLWHEKYFSANFVIQKNKGVTVSISQLTLSPNTVPRKAACQTTTPRFTGHYIVNVDSDAFSDTPNSPGYPTLNRIGRIGAALVHHIAEKWADQHGLNLPEKTLSQTVQWEKNIAYGNLWGYVFKGGFKDKLAFVSRAGETHILSSDPKLDKVIEETLQDIEQASGEGSEYLSSPSWRSAYYDTPSTPIEDDWPTIPQMRNFFEKMAFYHYAWRKLPQPINTTATLLETYSDLVDQETTVGKRKIGLINPFLNLSHPAQ